MYINLEAAKQHLNIDNFYTADDNYIMNLISVAEKVVEKNLDVKLENIAVKGVLPSPIIHAMLLFIGNMYASRESIAFASSQAIPYSYQYLIDLYRCYNPNSTISDEDNTSGGTCDCEPIDIIDNLDSERTDAALSANMGKNLDDRVEWIEAVLPDLGGGEINMDFGTY